MAAVRGFQIAKNIPEGGYKPIPRRNIADMAANPQRLLTTFKEEKDYEIPGENGEKPTRITVCKFDLTYLDSDEQDPSQASKIKINLPAGVRMSGIQKKTKKMANPKPGQNASYSTYSVMLTFDMEVPEHEAFFQDTMTLFSYWAQTAIPKNVTKMGFKKGFNPAAWDSSDRLSSPFYYEVDPQTQMMKTNPVMWVDLINFTNDEGETSRSRFTLPNPDNPKCPIEVDWDTIEGFDKWSVILKSGFISVYQCKAATKVRWLSSLPYALIQEIKERERRDKQADEEAAQAVQQNPALEEHWREQLAKFGLKSNSAPSNPLPANPTVTKPIEENKPPVINSVIAEMEIVKINNNPPATAASVSNVTTQPTVPAVATAPPVVHEVSADDLGISSPPPPASELDLDDILGV